MRVGTGSTTMATRSIPAEGGCDSRSSRTSVHSTRGSRSGAGSCSVPRVNLARDQPQSHMEHGGTNPTTFEDVRTASRTTGAARRQAARDPRSATRAPARLQADSPRGQARAADHPHLVRSLCNIKPTGSPTARRGQPKATLPDRQGSSDPTAARSTTRAKAGRAKGGRVGRVEPVGQVGKSACPLT